MEIGQYLIKARKNKSLSQEDVASSLNVSRQSVSLWECDQTIPSLDNLIALSKLYDVSIAVLTGQEKFVVEIKQEDLSNLNVEREKIELEASYKKFLILAFIFLGISTIAFIVPLLSTMVTLATITFSIISMTKKKNNYNLLTLIFGITYFMASIFVYINLEQIYSMFGF
ncbi:MAG: helix-turn-helix transcriptional regulator [Acholeplasmatales bacterium]|nr:helix-turn-helix transcriptional regulator [Acholeplasmatales bacterium]